ncbi:hypothetical protein [Halopseudomonas sp.]|uniref:hypothetical protein n=1 Tax=Halopseudomonas sp. TaxID=2901191 RepID=UPI0030039A73
MISLKRDVKSFERAKRKVSSYFSALKYRLMEKHVSEVELYALGYMFFLPGIASVLLLFVLSPDYSKIAVCSLAVIVLVVWSAAFLMEVAAKFSQITTNRYFLSALALVSIPVLKISSIWIGRFVNNTTGLDPSELPDATSALLALFVPLTWLYVFFALLTIVALAMLTVGALWSAVTHSPAQGRQFFARLVVTLFVVTYGFIFTDFLANGLIKLGEFIIVGAEYFKDARCENMSEHEFVARLESGVSVFNSETNEFRFTTCQE